MVKQWITRRISHVKHSKNTNCDEYITHRDFLIIPSIQLRCTSSPPPAHPELTKLIFFLLKPSFQKSGRSQTIRDFTFCRPSQIYRIIATSLSQILPINLAGNGKCAKNWNLRDRGTGAQQFRGLVMSEIHRRRPRRYKFEFSFVGNDRRPSQKSGTRRENRNTPDSPDLSPSIPDDRGYLRFRVFICRQNLRQSGNSKIPDRLGFSGHLKTRL